MEGHNRRRLIALACSGVVPWVVQPAFAQTTTGQPGSSPTTSSTPTGAASAASGEDAQTAGTQTDGARLPDAQAGDIIVTAQKRSERLQDVPMSITAADGAQLKTRGITSPDMLEKLVPGFTVNKTVYGTPVFFLRGVGFNDTTLGVSPAVAIYTDQLPIPFSAMARGTTLDLERVEVLKGPQGTLFGQNSTGGAVNFIAAKPTDQLAAGFDLTVGRFNEVDAEAFVSGPISDTISARIAVRNEYRDDWQRGYTIDQSIGQKDFHNGRLIVDWQPASRIRVELSATGWQDKSDSQQPQFIKYEPQKVGPGARPSEYPIASTPSAPRDDRAAAWDPDRSFQIDNYFYQFGGRVDIELTDEIDLTSLTSYARYGQNQPTDFDATIYPIGVNNDTGKIRSFSQELRLSGSAAADRIKWMIGGNYENDRAFERVITDPIRTSPAQIGPFQFDRFLVDNLQKIETKAVFGSLDYRLTPTLTVQGAVRYTKQNRDFRGCLRDSGDGGVAGALGFLSTLLTGKPQTIAPGACVTLNTSGVAVPIITNKLDEDNVSWRGSLNWEPNTDTLLYVNVTKGYKSGSFPNLPPLVVPEADPLPQESVLAYEAGTKLSFFSRKLQVTGAAFYYNYRDKQLAGSVIVQPLGIVPGLVSIPKTTVKGGEVSVTMRPLEGFIVTASGTYVDTRIDRNPVNPTGPYGNIADFRGQSFANSPKWQGVVDAQYRFDLGTGTHPYMGVSISPRSSTNGVLLTGDPSVAAKEALLKIPGYTLVDLRAGVELQDGLLRIEAFGRNVTNKYYIVGSQRGADFVTRFTGMPATYGVSLYYRFKK